MTDLPQIYLITPPDAQGDDFVQNLAACLDVVPVACVRIETILTDSDDITPFAESCRAVTEPRDVALILTEHVNLADRLGLDGVHLTDGSRSVGYARKELGDEAVIGAFCGTSRHDGLLAGEKGADYVSFGPLDDKGLGDGRTAEAELFTWWSEMVEVPVVAEGGLDQNSLEMLSKSSDFIAFGPEIWRADNPASELARLYRLIQAAAG